MENPRHDDDEGCEKKRGQKPNSEELEKYVVLKSNWREFVVEGKEEATINEDTTIGFWVFRAQFSTIMLEWCMQINLHEI